MNGGGGRFPALFSAAFAGLVRLGPRPLREGFGREMVGVFEQRLAEAAGHGRRRWLAACLSEFGGIGRLLLVEHWAQLRKGDETMTSELKPDTDVAAAAGRDDGWAGALLAALPHLLVTAAAFPAWLLIQLHIWGGHGFPPVAEWLFVGLIALMLVAAGLRGWPRWSGSYAGYGNAILFFMLLDGLTRLYRNVPAAVQHRNVLEPVSILAWLLLALLVVGWLARRDVLRGLLAVLPIAPIGMALVVRDETRGGEAVFLAAALLTAAAAFVIARLQRPAVGLLLVVVVNITAGPSLAYLSTYRSTTLPGEPSFGLVVVQSVAFLIYVAIFLSPIVLLLGWRHWHRPQPAT
jgi:hypothetical protein